MSKWTLNPRALLGCKLKPEKSVRKTDFFISVCGYRFKYT